jgi:guanylate kinase
MSSEEHKQLTKAVVDYKMPSAARQLLETHPPLIICGITGAGKNAVFAELVKLGSYQAVVSHTTRLPRVNDGVMEKEGIDYWFVDPATIARMISNQQFIEIKPVHRDFNGTSLKAYKQSMERSQIPVLIIDVQGADELVRTIPSLRPVFVLPPDFYTWRQRLEKRGAMKRADLSRRLQSATREIEKVLNNPSFDLVINLDQVKAATEIVSHKVGRDKAVLDLADELLTDIKEAKKRLEETS